MKSLSLIVILSVALPALAFAQADPAVQVEFTGTDTGLGMLAPPPTITQDGGTLHMRGFNGYSHIVLRRADSSTLFDGIGTFSLNANWSTTDFTGPVWGPFRMADAAGNTAEMTCNAVRAVIEPGTWQSVFHCTGVGTGGTIDGNLFRLTETITTHVPIPADFVGVITGSMVEPAHPNH